MIANAKAKRARKGCDWILANDVSPGTGTFGGDSIRCISSPRAASRIGRKLSKREIAERLADRIAGQLAAKRR